jgi:glycosyltransferase involved in cell wall biosynthesis
LKILHVIPSVAPRYGGPSVAVVEMCRALDVAGMEVMIATSDADGYGRLPVSIGRKTMYAGVPAIFFQRQWSEAFKYSHGLATWLGRHIRDFDVVHIHAVFSHASMAAAGACRKSGVPYIVRPLGTLDPWSVGQKALRKRLFWHLAVKRMLLAAAAIHYTAAEEQRLAESSLGLARGVVVPLGVPDDLFAEGDTTAAPLATPFGSDPYVLSLSRLHPKKGLDLLIPAFLELIRDPQFAAWRLVVAGDGDPTYRATLDQLVHSHGGEDRVHFPGWLQGAAKVDALRGAGLFTLPSYQENFGISVVEAMACGIAVLISQHVNLAPEIEAAGAGWVVPLEPARIGCALAAALASPEERKLRGMAGRALAQREFGWPGVAKQLRRLYESILLERRSDTEAVFGTK